ncbi:MAG TPA: response regulator [Candidatus Angelobacter sp.]
MSILLADDDVHLATFLSKSLESEGYAVHTALDEDTAVAELRRQNYKLIILDLNFGQTDGLKLLERLRAEGLETPVIVLSARNKVSDRVQSLRLGADDYVTKPFSFQELAARANALLRRKADPTLNVLRVEDLELDPALRRVSRGNRDIKLSIKEFQLLHLLMRHAGNEVTRQELMHEVWGSQPGSDSNLVDVYVNYLRKKVEFPREARLIYTIRGVGYRLGREAPMVKGPSEAQPPGPEPRSGKGIPASPPTFSGPAEPAVYQQTPWRALVNSLAHDLAQPLTSVRCFLEVAAMRPGNLSSAAPGDLKNIEQQADRAIGLAKAISALVREISVPTGPWILLGTLLEEVFDDFVVLLNSGLLTVERHWDPFIQVTSSPVLRQLLVLMLGKISGKNTRPIALQASASMKGSRCHLELRWKAVDGGAIQDAQATLGNDMVYLQEMLYSIGGEVSFEGATGIALKLPAASHSGGPQTQRETVQ